MKYLIGIDGGGTNARLLASSTDGEVLGRCAGKSTNVESNAPQVVKRRLEEMIGRFVRQSGCPLDGCLALCLGTAGVDTEKSRRLVEDVLREMSLPFPTCVVNDAEIALAAQTQGEPGVLLISGTGSIGFAIDGQGRTCRVGGYGYLVGDEGSAYWVARKAISAMLHAHDGIGPETSLSVLIREALGMAGVEEVVDFVYRANKAEIAKLAPAVVAAFEAGDRAAGEIMRGAAWHLAAMPIALGRNLRLEAAEYPLVFAGSMLLRTPWLVDQVRQSVLALFPRWRPMLLSKEAEWGAIYLAARRAGVRLPQ